MYQKDRSSRPLYSCQSSLDTELYLTVRAFLWVLKYWSEMECQLVESEYLSVYLSAYRLGRTCRSALACELAYPSKLLLVEWALPSAEQAYRLGELEDLWGERAMELTSVKVV